MKDELALNAGVGLCHLSFPIVAGESCCDPIADTYTNMLSIYEQPWKQKQLEVLNLCCCNTNTSILHGIVIDSAIVASVEGGI